MDHQRWVRSGGDIHMGVSKNSSTPKSSILIGFSIRNHIYIYIYIFGVPLFLETPIDIYIQVQKVGNNYIGIYDIDIVG